MVKKAKQVQGDHAHGHKNKQHMVDNVIAERTIDEWHFFKSSTAYKLKTP